MGDGDLYESNYWDGGGDWYYDPSTGEVYQSGGGGGSGDLPTGGLTEWWNLWYGTPSPLDQFNASDYGPPIASINTLEPGTSPSDSGSWQDWFNSWFPSADPGTLDYIPIDWSQIGTSVGLPGGPPATAIGVCPPGTGRGKRGAGDFECTPFDPPNTPSGQAQRNPATQAAAQAAAQQKAQQQQSALQQAAAACAAKGGRLVQTAQGYACAMPNGTQQSLSTSSLGGIPLWILILIGVVVLSR